MRAWVTGVLAVFILVSVPTTSSAFVDLGVALTPQPEGIFVVSCPFSHRLPDDPIVRQNQPGASHSHDFFGNRTTNAFSTYGSLRAGSTTCRRISDTAAYWVPTLSDGGVAIRPSAMSAYYTSRGKGALAIKPFPAGLRIVAGNANASAPQPMRVAVWSCGENRGTESSSVPLCALGSLRLHVRFPDCWNGSNLDFPDHKSHMAYSTAGRCPTTHGIEMPGLQINVSYPVRGGPTVALSSGSPYSAHADFFNAWDQTALNNLVRNCLNVPRNCGTGN